MNLTLFAHNDIEYAAKYFKIPMVMYDRESVYIMQENRCVFVGNVEMAIKWMKRNEGKFCESRFPLE